MKNIPLFTMSLIADEKKRREEENRTKGITSIRTPARQIPTPVEAQSPVVLASTAPVALAPDPMTPAPVTSPAQRTGPTVKPFDPNSGRERPEDLGFWRGWIRDRVRDGLKDEDGDGRYEVPMWSGLVNSGVNLVTPGNDRTNQQIADNKRDRERDDQARALVRGSGLQDQIPMQDNRYYDPDELKGRIDEITRGRNVADREDAQGQEISVITEGNKPEIESVRSGERQNTATNRSNESITRDTNASNESMNTANNSVTTRGQDKEFDISTLGMANELDIAEIQRQANQDTITSQNQLAMQQYETQMEMYNLDRQDRREQRQEDKRQDALSALLAGLTSLGIGFSL